MRLHRICPLMQLIRKGAGIEALLPWVAGHMDSAGNEAADKLAKAATEFGSSDRNLLPRCLESDLPNSLAATKRNTRCITSNDIRRWWKYSERYKRIRAIDPSLPAGRSRFILATSDISFAQSDQPTNTTPYRSRTYP